LAPSLRSGAQRRRLEDFRRGAPADRAVAPEAGRLMRARCLCRGIRIEVSGKVGPLVDCHCTRCQRASGTAFGANANVRAQYWKIAAGSELIREYESSPGVWRAFCSRCGSPIYSRWAAAPDMFRLRLGLLADDPERRALAHFWVESKAPWYEITDDLPQFAKAPADHEGEITTLLRSS
jgi:hypothetical protein